MTAPSDGGGVGVTAHGWGWRHAGRSAWALRHLDVTIDAGQRVLLLGPSGSGKSTFLQGLAGLLGREEDGHAEGRLLVDGVDPAQRRNRIGMVLQDPDAQVMLSRVGDDVAFGMENFNVAADEIWPRARRALDAVGLKLPFSHDTSHLSGGQQQRLALAGVLAMNPGLILLDEPTANLDPAGVLDVVAAVTTTAETTGATVVVVEHRTATWLPVVDRVIAFGADGQLVADGPPEPTIRREHARLAAAGIWLPELPLPSITRRDRAGGDVLLTASGLAPGHPGGPALHDGLDFDIRARTTTVVTGPNGGGKTTLALTVGGLLPPVDGKLEAAADFAPSPRRRSPIRWRSRELLTRIGSVFQNPEHQFLTGTVRDELALGPRALKRADAAIDATTDALLERLRLTHLAHVNPYTLSGGEQRRLSVATVLATGPEVLVLDEPTFGQDRTTWEELLRLLAELTDEGSAVVAVTHDADFADLLADQRIELPGQQTDSMSGATR